MGKGEKRGLRGLMRESAEALRRKRGGVTAVYLMLRFAVIVVMVAQFFNRNFENVFLCILTLVLLMLPTVIERSLKSEI